MPFSAPLDIANRMCQHLGVRRIAKFSDQSLQATEALSSYDKLRLAETQRNLWRFSTRRTMLRPVGLDSVLWKPPAWDTTSATNYAAGAIVRYTPADGVYAGAEKWWQLKSALAPSTTRPDNDPTWEHFAGPLAIDLFNVNSDGNAATAYQAGEIVLQPSTYAGGTTYAANAVVNSGGLWYVSLVGSNIGNTPASSPTFWTPWTSAGRGNSAYGVTATKSPIPLTYPGTVSFFISLQNNNNDALTSSNWLNLNTSSFVPLSMVWPLSSGPSYDPNTPNVFYLPYGYLKRAPTDPKGGQFSWLGAHIGSVPDDYVLEGNYIISNFFGPIMLRFVADITDVAEMDPMFCEGLGARMAWELGPILDADPQRRAEARTAYRTVIADARTANSIEIGPISQPEDRLITVRA